MTDIRWHLPTPAPDWALFLDVDGTLLEIAPAPGAVTVPDGLPDTLIQVARLLDNAVALVSGRTVNDLDKLFRRLPIAEAGQHGSEIRWPDGHAEYFGTGDSGLSALLEPILRFAQVRPGLMVEDKGQTIAVHCRQAPQYQTEIAAFLADLVNGKDAWLDVMSGRLVVELKPRGVSKRTAVERLMRSAPFAGRLPIFIGDDTTDEDGFAAARDLGGHGIRIGLTGESIASFRLPDPKAVRRFLGEIIRHLNLTANRSSHAVP